MTPESDPPSAAPSDYTPLPPAELLSLAFFIPRVLFLSTQYRITDLVFVVAVLGNVEGLLIATLDGPSACVPCVWVGFLALGGMTWGLWIATCLEETRVLRRWGLMVCGLLFPFAAIGTPVGLVLTLAGAGMGPQGWPQLLLGAVLLVVFGYAGCEALVLHRRALAVEEAETEAADE